MGITLKLEFSLFSEECPKQRSQRRAESQVSKWAGFMAAKWKAGGRNDEVFWQAVSVCLAERESLGNKLSIMMRTPR